MDERIDRQLACLARREIESVARGQWLGGDDLEDRVAELMKLLLAVLGHAGEPSEDDRGAFGRDSHSHRAVSRLPRLDCVHRLAAGQLARLG